MARRLRNRPRISGPRQVSGGPGFMVLGIIIAAAMIAYPPWHLVIGGGITKDAGWSFIWKEPFPGASIDIATLLIEIAVMVMALVALSIIFRRD